MILFQTNHTENSHCFSVLNEDKIKEKILSQMLKAQCHIKIHLLVKHLSSTNWIHDMNQRTVEETRGKSIQTYVTATAVALQLNHPPKWMNLFRSFSNLGWLFYCKDHILVSMYRHPSSTILDVYINLVDIKYKSRYIFVLEQLITVLVNITPTLSPQND